jgi:hypothetical protein
VTDDTAADLTRKLAELDQDIARAEADGRLLAAFHKGCVDGGISKSQAAILTRDYARYSWGCGDDF